MYTTSNQLLSNPLDLTGYISVYERSQLKWVLGKPLDVVVLSRVFTARVFSWVASVWEAPARNEFLPGASENSTPSVSASLEERTTT
uniref:Uncharacterized protein n=1 Tax=Physcomitrium patens TaxID=3218 RepID=A0A2K1IJI0_PHYPA|nr:hypothetical protein PHYPA_028126 [Physcomitrium patens]